MGAVSNITTADPIARTDRGERDAMRKDLLVIEMPVTILVIEDNLANLTIETDLLEMDGYRVLQARTAEEGIQIAAEEQPRVVVMDISLPGMDGLTATRVLRATPQTEAIPVVAVSAFSVRREAIAAGCVGYIDKPIDTRRFSQHVLDIVGA